MKRIIARILGGFVGMAFILVFIHVLCFCMWLIVSFFLWENPITIMVKGYTNLWQPAIENGWNLINRITFIGWYGLGLLFTSKKITLINHEHNRPKQNNKTERA